MNDAYLNRMMCKRSRHVCESIRRPSPSYIKRMVAKSRGKKK